MKQHPAVLVVDDNAIIRKVAVLSLKRLGIQADIAVNGKEAVEKQARHQYDIILMDVAMPELDGLQATQLIRKSDADKKKRVPIIGITANATREKCLSAGMDDYIMKPPDYERVLRRWLPEYFERKSG